ncbi:MAG: IS3 family transposase, partial [Clostridia bacterium]|nr:IS3 family transposase [Clostridia bacterium]
KRRVKLKNRVQELFYEYRQVLGAGKIAALLRDQGVKTSEKYVAELMLELGVHSVLIGAKAIYEREQRKFVNRINQQFKASKPNELWLSNVTYFRFGEETFYICAVLDVYTRKIVAYRVSQNNSTQLTKSTLKEAYLTRHPDSGLILHTDRDSNYVSKTFCKAMSSMNITQSYSRTRKPHDNAMMESFFSTLKKEELYRTNYRSVRDFKESLSKYIDMYNNSRPHSALGNKSPNSIETAYYSLKDA